MEKRQKQVSGEDLFVGRENWKTIPIDLLIEIFSRLPAKSVARFRCMSKQWASILHRRDFTEMFLTVSSARPRLSFALQHNGKWLFFSAPQPLYSDQTSSPLAADHYKPFPTYFSLEICAPVRGLICTKSRKPMICNPSTGQYVALPKAASIGSEVKTFFGYDPINQIFKVLSVSEGFRVLTLGTGELSWRMIQGSIRHFPLNAGICINGVLYYSAECIGNGNLNPYMVVCFDVRFETFKFLAVDNAISRSTMINCKGRLGAIQYDFPGFIHGNARIVLWVLDDADEQIWLKDIYVLPPLWSDLVAQTRPYIVGMTCTGEIVLSPCYTLSDPFCIFYYNVERNTIVIVEIELGIEASKRQRIYTFIDHIENVKLMQMLRTS